MKQAHSHYIHVVKGVKRKMKRFVRKIKEDAPANAAGGGNIAGLGIGPQGEPGVNRSKTAYKKRNEQETPIMQDAINRRLPQPMFEVKRGMFAGNETFIVPENVFHSARMEKSKGKHWTKYLQETDYGRAISAHARKNRKKPIILQCEKTGYMCYAKYGSK